VAFLSYVALDRRPNAADTAAALERARELRARVAAGGAEAFAQAAREESADSVSGREGGELGWIRRDDAGYDPDFLAGLRRVRPGQVSEPVRSSFGYHLIRVAQQRGDSIRAARILVPIELVGEHLDLVESRADTLDRITVAQTDPAALEDAARLLRLEVSRTRLVQGDRLTLGSRAVPDVSVWAFDTPVGETSHVIEGREAYYVFRVDSLRSGGVPPLAQIREAVAQSVRFEKKKAAAGRRAGEVAAQVLAAPSLDAAGAALALDVQRLGPFTRAAPPTALAVEPLVLGTAFGLRVGDKTGPVGGERGHYFVELLSRKAADSTAWLAQRDAQRAELMGPARQARLSAFLADLRADAKIEDRRQELARQQPVSLPMVY
jgi:peptidyl-prolyl cis-trans isomerase D